MALVIRSTGDQPVAIRRKYAFFHQHHQRAELNWIICMRGLSEPFYPLSFSFIHTHTNNYEWRSDVTACGLYGVYTMPKTITEFLHL